MGSLKAYIYWKGETFWPGKLCEHPEIMTQGEPIDELEENIKDVYLMMVMEDVPEEYKVYEAQGIHHDQISDLKNYTASGDCKNSLVLRFANTIT